MRRIVNLPFEYAKTAVSVFVHDIFLNPKFQASGHFYGCTVWFVSDLVETQKAGFLPTQLILAVAARVMSTYIYIYIYTT